MNQHHLTLTGYFRSTTSYRVRIALNLKQVTYQQRTLSLLKREHKSEEFLEVNPQGLVPVLQVDQEVLLQSPAIVEWLEEVYPDPPLLPLDALSRQRVRAVASLIGCDIHPVNNLRILNRLRQDFAADEAAVSRWIREWIGEGFAALETLLRPDLGQAGFCVGDTPTIADCYLIPQVYSARRFGVDVTSYPRISEIERCCGALPAFAAAHPDCQPDTPSSA